MTVSVLPTGDRRRQAIRVARVAVRKAVAILRRLARRNGPVRLAARKAVSILRQLVRRNGPAWLAVRNEVIGVAAWARRHPRAALTGGLLLTLVGMLSGWPVAAVCALAWWALTRIPRARAERRWLTFHALATVTRTPTEVRIYQSATKKPVRPRSRVHVRRWTPLRIRGVPLLPGTVPARGVVTYSPRFADDYPGAARRAQLEQVLEQRLRGWRDDVSYRFDWQPGLCRVSFRVQPPLPVGRLAYAHQEHLPWHRLPIGPTHGGSVASVDLARRPHVILSGATGSGKTSVAMVWLAHLLRFPDVEVVLVDPARLDFHWANGYVGCYASTLQTMTGALAQVRAEAERRMGVYETVDDWRAAALRPFDAMVLIVEELAVLVRAVKRRMGKDAAVAFCGDVLDLAEMGRKVNVHVILIAQQPNADVFDGTEARDQFEWNVLCANPSKEHRGMLSSRGLRIPNLNRPGRVAVVEGLRDLTVAQAFWLASPTTPGVSRADRAEALRWLPSETTAKVTVTAVHRDGRDGRATAAPAGADSAEQTPVIDMTGRAGRTGRPRRRRSS